MDVAIVSSAQILRWLGAGATAALLTCRPEASPDLGAPPPSKRATPVVVPSSTQVSPPSSSTLPPPPPLWQRVPAGHGSGPGAGRFAFEFEDAALPELVQFIGNITGKRFILTGKLPAVHATVRSPEPVTADEAYGAFLSILQANGLTVVQSGEFWKILPSPGVLPEPAAGH